MASGRVEKTGHADSAAALDLALEQSHEVKAKVETCADDLATANETLKEEIAGGTTVLSAHETLLAGTSVESKVQECAVDLQEVTETLAQGIDDLARTELALTESREILADTQAALAISQEEERDARRRAMHDSMTGLPNGGDEFLYLLVNPQGRANIERIAGLVSTNVAKPIVVGGRQFVVSASIGIALYPVDGTTGDEQIQRADMAMYSAKKHGRSCVFFDAIE